MYKLLEIIKKNFKLLTRSKSSALIVLLGPLVLMLLISLAFNTSSLFDIKIGAYSSSYSELSESLLQQLEGDQFKVIKIESEEKCINGVKNGDIHVCSIFPADLNVQTQGNIVFYVDKTRLNFVYIVINSVSQKVSIKSSELSTALTNTLLSSLSNVDTKLSGANLAAIKTNLGSITSQVNSVKSDISSIDTSSNKTGLNVSKIEDEISNIQSSANLSSATFSDLNDLIILLSGEISKVTDKLNSVSSIKESSSSSLDSIKNIAETNTADIESLESNINEIIENINSIEIKEVEKIVSPVSTEIKAVSLEEETNLSSTFPALVILVILFAGILLSSTTIIQEKVSKAYFRNFITPTKDFIFLIGNYLSTILIILVQLLIIFMVMVYTTEISLGEGVISNIFILLLLVSSIFVLIGMVIGYLFKSGETANIASVSVASILLFFSNTILPIETLPTGIRAIANLNPFILGEGALRRILLFGANLDAVSSQIYILLLYFVVLAVLAYVAREFTKRRLA